MTNEHDVKARQRREWIDIAKAISIMAVVLLHATEWSKYVLEPPTFIVTINSILAPIRMPLFFCMSGILGVKWIRSEFGDILRGKVSYLIWPFLVWQPMVFLYKYCAATILPDQNHAGFIDHVGRMLASPLRPNGELWFLWALTVFFMAARLSRMIPAVWQLIVAGSVSALWFAVAQPILGPGRLRMLGDGWDGAIGLYFFFILGALFSTQIKQVAENISRPRALAVAAPALLILFLSALKSIDQLHALGLPLRIIGLVAGVSISIVIGKSVKLEYIGRNTLPIYLGHSMIIVLILCCFYAIHGGLYQPEWIWLNSAAILALTCISVDVCLRLAKIQRFKYGRLLYAPPYRMIYRTRPSRLGEADYNG